MADPDEEELLPLLPVAYSMLSVAPRLLVGQHTLAEFGSEDGGPQGCPL
jgi:hypothetical protein